MAVGEDYNILLVTRDPAGAASGHGTDEGMRRGLSRTGGTITSCGLIMAGTFATLMLAGLNTLVQIGFALAFGVLLDTFVVRPFLVPTFLLLMSRRPRQCQNRRTGGRSGFAGSNAAAGGVKGPRWADLLARRASEGWPRAFYFAAKPTPAFFKAFSTAARLVFVASIQTVTRLGEQVTVARSTPSSRMATR